MIILTISFQVDASSARNRLTEPWVALAFEMIPPRDGRSPARSRSPPPGQPHGLNRSHRSHFTASAQHPIGEGSASSSQGPELPVQSSPEPLAEPRDFAQALAALRERFIMLRAQVNLSIEALDDVIEALDELDVFGETVTPNPR